MSERIDKRVLYLVFLPRNNHFSQLKTTKMGEDPPQMK